MQISSYIKKVSHWWRTSFSYGGYKSLPFPRVLNKIWYLQTSYCWQPIVGLAGKALLGLGNNVEIHNRETFRKYVENRDPSTPLLTLCNHASMIDDPLLLGHMCDLKWLFNANLMKWSLGAKEILYTNRFFTYVMCHGKTVPIVRGDGVYQEGITFAISQLNRGQWVHIFPEGKVTLDPIRLKWGIGRMISECTKEAIILPYWHSGMEDVFPMKTPYYPRLRKKVTVLFGEPIRYYDLLQRCRSEGRGEIETRKAMTDIVQEALYELKPKAERLHLQ